MFVAKAMHVLLASQEAGFKGIRMLATMQELVDAALYMQGSLQNLIRLEMGMQIFCKASAAKINWE